MSISAPDQHDDATSAPVEFQYMVADFIVAYQLHGALTRRGWIFLLLFVVVCMAALAALDSDTTYDFARRRLPLAALVPIGAALGALAIKYGYLPSLARRTFAKQPLAHLAVTTALRLEGLTTQSARGISTLQWQDFIRWRTNDNTTLLYLSPSLFIIIPARLATLGFPMDRLKAALLREVGPPLR